MCSNSAENTDADRQRDEAERFRREFYRRMAEQGTPVRPPTAGPGWTLPEPLPFDADEASAMVVRLRRCGP